jgi:hypothetical protein
MTKKQKREYKAANQARKANIIHLAKYADVRQRGYYASLRVGQSKKA